MPTNTSRRTGAAARRQRRRERQRKRRLSATFPHGQRNHRRSLPKRQLREQSGDVDDCFEDCQEFGYHLDPDVHVGSLAAQGNPFSILDPNFSSHSTPDPIPTPYQDHTIRPLNPFLAELEWYVAKKSYPEVEVVEPNSSPKSASEDKSWPSVSRFWWRPPRPVDDLEANRLSLGTNSPPAAQDAVPPSVQTSSIHATPPSAARVKLPGTFPQDNASESLQRLSKKRKLNDAPPPSFLTGYRIPSPLLYHKPSRDALPNIDRNENTCVCLGPSFEHTGSLRHSCFDSGRNGSCCAQTAANSSSEATQALLQEEYRFVAAALPNMGAATPFSPIEQAVLSSDPEFYTNTRSYLKSSIASKNGTGNSTPNPQMQTPPLTKEKKLTAHVYAAKDVRSTYTPPPPNDIASFSALVPTKPTVPRQHRQIFRNHDLVFPKLPDSAACHDKSLDRYFERTTNFWSKQQDEKQQRQVSSTISNNDPVDHVPDRRSKFQELWDTYEKAVLDPRKEEPNVSRQVCVLSDSLGSSSNRKELSIIDVPCLTNGSDLLPAPFSPIQSVPIDIKLPKEVNLAKCTALVPAKLYEKQYVGLTRSWNSDIWNLEQRPLPTTNTIIKQIQDAQSRAKIKQAVDWLTEDLDLPQLFDDDMEDDEACLPWLQSGWDGHLFYPEQATPSVPLPVSSSFEEIELCDEGYLVGIEVSETSGLTQLNEEADEWLDWEDDASDWSEPSEDEFFEFEL